MSRFSQQTIQIALAVVITALAAEAYTTSSANNLYTALSFQYQRIVRPSNITSVAVKFGVSSINFLDVRSQQFSVTGWIEASWVDGRYSWVPSAFENIKYMYLGSTTCWNPKLAVQNAMAGSISVEEELAFRIDSTGNVSTTLWGVFTVHCSTDSAYYPFDTQSCSIRVASAYPSDFVVLVSEGIDTSQVTNSAEWTLTSASSSNDTLTHSVLTFTFDLARRSSYSWLYQVLVPVAVLSFLGPCAFIVPPECASKLGLPVAVLLAEVLFAVIIFQDVPILGDATPIISTYILILIILSSIETLFTTIVIRIHQNKARQSSMSSITRAATALLTTVTCVCCDRKEAAASSSPTESEIESHVECAQATEIQLPEVKNHIKRRLSLKTISPDNSFATSSKENFQKGRHSRAWADTGTLCGRGEVRETAWEELARAMDRVFLIVFIILRLILTVVYTTQIKSGSS